MIDGGGTAGVVLLFVGTSSVVWCGVREGDGDWFQVIDCYVQQVDEKKEMEGEKKKGGRTACVKGRV